MLDKNFKPKPIFKARPLIDKGSITTMKDLILKFRQTVIDKSADITDEQVMVRKYELDDLGLTPETIRVDFLENYAFFEFGDTMPIDRFCVVWGILRGYLPE